MTVVVPDSLPSQALYPKLLPALVHQLSSSPVDQSSLPLLRTTLHVIASLRLGHGSSVTALARSNIPLDQLFKLSSADPTLLKVPVLLDGIVAYPLHVETINTILCNAFDENPDLVEIFRIDIVPSLVNRLCASPSIPLDIGKSAHILLSVVRAHDALLALALEDSEDVLRALGQAYDALSRVQAEQVKETLAAKSDILMICRELLDRVGHGASEEAMLEFMGSRRSGEAMKTASLRSDWEVLVGDRPGQLGEASKDALVRYRDEEASQDPRVHSIQQLFPSLPAHLLLSALSHSTFASQPSSSRATPSEQAAPLLEAILNQGEGLPDELVELKEAIRSCSQGTTVSESSAALSEESQSARPATKPKVQRRNIWDEDQLDMDRLKLKDDDSALPTLSNAIPDHLRASIMRLVENQAIEEDERRRALRDANVLDDDDDDYEETDGVLTRVKLATGDDEEGDELAEEDGVKITRDPSSADQAHGPSDRQRLDMLRTAYIGNPALFERDGVTRRSNERKKLREATGWDDSQIEGWRIMLDRDPHKEAILAAHGERMSRSNTGQGEPRSQDGAGSDAGSGRGGRGGGGRGGRGGGGRGSGGGRGGGSGGGRGREIKGSRGHSNAARTRGHDKKMGRMGAV
ncbi:hypothetical protein IAU60_001272 [Kwoniella sp. DSM 27419]